MNKINTVRRQDYCIRASRTSWQKVGWALRPVQGAPNRADIRSLKGFLFYGSFWARYFKYKLIADFWYTLIVIRTLGHILRQILVAKIPISHRGESNPRTSDLESDTLAPYQQAVIINRFCKRQIKA